MQPHDETAFFDAFDAALGGDVTALDAWLEHDECGQALAVYRNTIASGAVDALVATYSTVVMMTGADWFRAAAREYAREHPPTGPALIHYGNAFPEWLAAFEPAADAPYLGDIARLDWLWWQAWSAGEAALLDGAELAALAPEQLGAVTLGLHPGVRIAAFECGAPSLWLAHQAPARGEAHVLGDEAERMLFVRCSAQVDARVIEVGPFAFLGVLAEGGSLLAAAEAAMAADPNCALHQVLVTGLALGLFTHIAPIERNDRHDF
jgi:hypothetical protein